MKQQIATYKFEDSKSNIITVAVIHIILAYTLKFDTESLLFAFGRPMICFVSGVVFTGLYFFYNWHDQITNKVILALYGGVLFFEWWLYGIPQSPLALSSGMRISKGFMLEIFLNFTPYLYTGLRLTGIALLTSTILWSHRLYISGSNRSIVP